MKRILIILLGLFSVAYGQFSPTSAKTAMKWGVSVGTRDSSAYAANDSLVVVINRQGRMMYRSTDGYWKVLGTSSDSTAILSQVVRTFGNQTVGGAKTFTDTIRANSPQNFFGTNGTDGYLFLRGFNNSTGRFLAQTGLSVVYNGLLISSNPENSNTLPRWDLDLGGNDAVTFGNLDGFNIRRKRTSVSPFTSLFRIDSSGNVTANSFVRVGGLSTQYQMADGSVTSNNATLNYIPKISSGTNVVNSQLFDDGNGIGIGTTSLTGYNFRMQKNLSGAATSVGFSNEFVAQSGVSAEAIGYRSELATQATPFTLGIMNHYRATQGNFGVGSTVTNQYGFAADNTLIGATNNYGFFGNIASGTGRFNLYMQGTANNYMEGALGIGRLPLSDVNFRLGRNITGSTGPISMLADGVVQSGATSLAAYFLTQSGTQNATFTLPTLSHYRTGQGTRGAASTITEQNGFDAIGLNFATNNYGFRGRLNAATGVWNGFFDGTANNHFNGRTLFGTTMDNGLDRGQFNGSVSMQKLRGNSATPTLSLGASGVVGTGATSSIIGNDMAGEITLTTGTGISTTGTVLTLTFSSAYANAPFVTLTAASESMVNGGNPTISRIFVNETTTTFQVILSTHNLSTSTEYKFNYQVIGR